MLPRTGLKVGLHHEENKQKVATTPLGVMATSVCLVPALPVTVTVQACPGQDRYC